MFAYKLDPHSAAMLRARLGGEEFAALILERERAAMQMVEHLRYFIEVSLVGDR